MSMDVVMRMDIRNENVNKEKCFFWQTKVLKQLKERKQNRKDDNIQKKSLSLEQISSIKFGRSMPLKKKES